MNVTIFGSGYVGLVTGACLAEVGNNVVCVDVDPAKIDLLNSGGIPIYEPGLEEMVQRNREAGRLSFTTDAKEGVDHGLFQFIAVGTPPDEDGSADLQYVLAVAGSIAEHMSEYKVIIDKSTVPVGTADKVKEPAQAVLDQRGVTTEFDVVSNPEFLKEGAALDDFMRPERIIIGTDNPRTTELLRVLYTPFNRNHDRLVAMDIRSAELTKYAANAMLATKISFMNELSRIAEAVGADIEHVRVGIGSDPRIGYHFIYPGCGYGGSCFPKDVKALAQTSRQYNVTPELLDAVEAVNAGQKQVLFNKIKNHFGDLSGRSSIAVWGLSFKPNTDDMREAPSLVILPRLMEEGATVRAYDPAGLAEASQMMPGLVACDNAYHTAEGADCLVIMTEWNQFRNLDWEQLGQTMRERVVVDLRNVYNPSRVRKAGFQYFSVGRP